MRGIYGWKEDNEIYTPGQVGVVLNELHIQIAHESGDEFLAYCPFHYNRDTPAFCVNQTTGLFHCQNPACGESGTLQMLVQRLKGWDKYRTRRYLKSNENPVIEIKEPEPIKEFDYILLDSLERNFWRYSEGQKYMHTRGFNDKTLKEFKIGYSALRQMVTVPFYDHKGMAVGLIGRSIHSKTFNYSKGLPRGKVLFNLHNAKNYEAVGITEATFDCMRSVQAGYPNTVALGGGHITDEQIYYLNRYFNTIVILTDNDPYKLTPNCKKCNPCKGHSPGRELGLEIANALPNKQILWGAIGEEIYPHKAKDLGDLTDDEIKVVWKNALSDFEYRAIELDNRR